MKFFLVLALVSVLFSQNTFADTLVDLAAKAQIGSESQPGMAFGAEGSADFVIEQPEGRLPRELAKTKLNRIFIDASVRGARDVDSKKFELERARAGLRVPVWMKPVRGGGNKELIGLLSLGGQYETDRLHDVSLKGFAIEPISIDVSVPFGSMNLCTLAHPAIVLGKNEIGGKKGASALDFDWSFCLEDENKLARVTAGMRRAIMFADSGESDASVKVGSPYRDQYYLKVNFNTPKNTQVGIEYVDERSVTQAGTSLPNKTVFVNLGTHYSGRP